MTIRAPSQLVLEYRPPLADRPLTRLTTWLATPMSSRWRMGTLVASALVLWGAAWLPGAGIVEGVGWLGLPPMWSPPSEEYARWQLVLLVLAVSSPLFWWPLRVSMFIQRPLLNRFAWHAYADAPMLDPPATPRLVGMFVVTRVRASPGGVELRVLGNTAAFHFSADGPADDRWPFSNTPWYTWWVIPPSSGAWSVDSLVYRLYFN